MPDLTNTYLEQIEAVLNEYEALPKEPDLDDTYALERERLNTLCRAVVHRIAPDSPYTTELSKLQGASNMYLIPRIVGVVEALQADLKAGYLKTVSELLHGEVSGIFSKWEITYWKMATKMPQQL